MLLIIIIYPQVCTSCLPNGNKLTVLRSQTSFVIPGSPVDRSQEFLQYPQPHIPINSLKNYIYQERIQKD